LNSAPSSPIMSLLKNPRILPSGQVTHYNVTIWVGNPLQYTIWAGNPLQCDHLGR
jgi:hypothetical protein